MSSCLEKVQLLRRAAVVRYVTHYVGLADHPCRWSTQASPTHLTTYYLVSNRYLLWRRCARVFVVSGRSYLSIESRNDMNLGRVSTCLKKGRDITWASLNRYHMPVQTFLIVPAAFAEHRIDLKKVEEPREVSIWSDWW